MLASNRYKMFLNGEQKGTYSERKKKKILEEELGSTKKRKEDMESVAKRLIDTADMKSKEADKQKDAT